MFLRSEYEVASRSEVSPARLLATLNERLVRFVGRFHMHFTALAMILDLGTGTLMQPDPMLFTTNAVGFDYDPSAGEPKERAHPAEPPPRPAARARPTRDQKCDCSEWAAG